MTDNIAKKSGVEKNALNKVPMSERQPWGSIALIWIGTMICIPSLMLGGLLVTGLTLTKSLLAAFIGYLIIAVYMCFQGMQCTDMGLPTVSAARMVFGEKGSKIVISTVLAIACLGWFGFQTNVCGSAFSGILNSVFGINIPVWISSLIWGFIMLATAIYGFKALEYLNYIAVPALILVSVYGAYIAISKYGTTILSTHQPSTPFPFLQGIAMAVGSFAVGGVIAGDYSRYAKNRGDCIKSSVFGVLPAGLIMITLGAVMSLLAGTYDISLVLTQLGVPAFGLIALILATWTTNTVNAYSGGLAITNIFGLDDSKRSIATAAAGILGTVLAIAGIINYFVSFLMILTSSIPPIAGTMIADYWIIKKGDVSKCKIQKGVNWAGILSWLAGSIIAITVKIGIQPINGIIVSMIVYLVLVNIMEKSAVKVKPDRQTE